VISNPISASDDRQSNLKNNGVCDAINCFLIATESIKVDVGKFGFMSLHLCKDCLKIFDINRGNENQSDCFGSPTIKQSG
jgi:hypothetical protein